MKLDVGCGNHKLDGAIGIDRKKSPIVDVVQDLNQTPWNLTDSTFDFIRCQHVIEHIQNLPGLVQEMYRVARDGCEIEFRTPHYSSWTSWGDPTHCHHFGLTTIPQLFSMELPEQNYEIIETKLKFTGSVLDFWGWLAYKISPKMYEKYFTWQFPAYEIICRIRLRKSQ